MIPRITPITRIKSALAFALFASFAGQLFAADAPTTPNSDALIWAIVVGISSVLANIAIVISTWRRKPPLEGQFADRQENVIEHERLHARISELRTEREKLHEDLRKDITTKLDELLQRTAHLVGYGGKK